MIDYIKRKYKRFVNRISVTLIDRLINLNDPYPVRMNKLIKTDEDYVRLVPDEAVRTAVSWYLMGESFRVTKQRVIKILEDEING